MDPFGPNRNSFWSKWTVKKYLNRRSKSIEMDFQIYVLENRPLSLEDTLEDHFHSKRPSSFDHLNL